MSQSIEYSQGEVAQWILVQLRISEGHELKS